MPIEKEIREFSAVALVQSNDKFLLQTDLNVTNYCLGSQIRTFLNASFQGLNADLSAIATLVGQTGIVCRTQDTSYVCRTLVAGSNKISITNPQGLIGDPTIDVQQANLVLAQSQITNLVVDLAAKQPLDPTLTALAAFNTNGFLVQTAADTFAGRSLTGTADQVNIANGSGVAGNPVFSLPQSIALTSSPTFGNLTLSGLTASRVVVSDGAKLLTSSAVTTTELGYLAGVTSAIQTQINGKQASIVANQYEVLYYNGGVTSNANLTFDGRLNVFGDADSDIQNILLRNASAVAASANASSSILWQLKADDLAYYPACYITVGKASTWIDFSQSSYVSIRTRVNGVVYRSFRLENNNTVIGNQAAVGIADTTGFIYMPSCAGTMVGGAPTAYTGKVPMVIDSTNKKIGLYIGGWVWTAALA